MAHRMSRPERAMQVWQILTAAAHDRRTLTYEQLGEMLGMGGAGVFAQILGLIMIYCDENNLPPLTCLVVNKKTGIPGTGFGSIQDLPPNREAVYRERWYKRFPVQISDFREITDRH
jgi:hypothetical protein